MEYTEDQLSAEYPFTQNPWCDGVYLVNHKDGHQFFSWFKDGAWYCGNKEIFDARQSDVAYKDIMNMRKSWRGLRVNPNAPTPKKGKKRKTMYVVAETVGPHSSHIDHKRIHAAYDSPLEAAKKSKSLRDSGLITARVFPTKRFHTPEHD